VAAAIPQINLPMQIIQIDDAHAMVIHPTRLRVYAKIRELFRPMMSINLPGY